MVLKSNAFQHHFGNREFSNKYDIEKSNEKIAIDRGAMHCASTCGTPNPPLPSPSSGGRGVRVYSSSFADLK